MKKAKKIVLGMIGCIIFGFGLLLGWTLMKQDMSTQNEELHIATWIDDDTVNSKLPKVKEICDKNGIKCSFACVAQQLELNKYLNSTLMSYSDEGFDIINHSYSHGIFWKSNSEEYDLLKCKSDMEKSIDIMEKYGYHTDCFVMPYGEINEELENLVKPYFQVAIDVNGGANDLENIDWLNVNRIFIRPVSNGGYSILQYYEMIDEAYENDQWLVFGTHSGIDKQWDSELVEIIIKYAKAKGFQFETLSNAVGKLGNAS